MVNQSTEKKNTRQIQMTIEGHKVTVSFAQEANPTLSALAVSYTHLTLPTNSLV